MLSCGLQLDAGDADARMGSGATAMGRQAMGIGQEATYTGLAPTKRMNTINTVDISNQHPYQSYFSPRFVEYLSSPCKFTCRFVVLDANNVFMKARTGDLFFIVMLLLA